MFFKDMRRAERRWRSQSKYLTRLRADWADHGRQGVPIYRRELIDGKWVACEITGTTMCGCFDLTSKQAYRFKDSPTGGHSKRRCGCSEPCLDYKVERQMEAKDDWHKRKRRDGTRISKSLCSRCGFLLGKGPVEFHVALSWTSRSGMCEGCSKIMAERSVYWFNGRRQEFVKKPA